MARGSVSKQVVIEQILKTFAGSFLYNDSKEIRIPLQEDGEEVQIKVTLTAAKTNVSAGEDNAVPGSVVATTVASVPTQAASESSVAKVTAEEQERVKNLMASLNL